MKILLDSEGSQAQVQTETGLRLNTLFGAIRSISSLAVTTSR